MRVDRHSQRDAGAGRRLHLDRGRGQRPRYLCHQRPARYQDRGLAALSQCGQCLDPRRQQQHAVQKCTGRRECHEGEARSGVGCKRRHQFLGPRGDRSVHSGARSHLQARVLRWRRSGGHRNRCRRDRGHRAARGRAGQHDPRQPPARARGAVRPAARARRLWHDPANHSAVAGFKPDANYFGIFVPKNVRRRPADRST